MPIRFETVNCPACDCSDYETALEVGDRFNTIPDRTFVIVRCKKCGLMFVNPRPDKESISEFYRSENYDPFGGDQSNQSLTSKLYRVARPFSIRRKAARVVRELPAKSRTLDVGCATGEFMVELRRRGFEPFGVEPDPGAAEFARNHNGLTVWTGTIEQVPDTAAPFGLITLWHVLEHVHDLKGTFARAYQLLGANGRLVVAVPNPTSSDANFYRERWVAWDAPRHLYDFEPSVMIELMTKSGFATERLGAVAFDAFYHSILSEPKSSVGLLRGLAHGSVSYLQGILGRPGSSELYLAFKH